jgi:anti-anti-sigma factor
VNLTIVEEAVGNATILATQGRVDSNTSKQLGERLAGLLEADARRIVIDLGQIIYISSAGFRILLIAARQAEARGASLALCCLSPEVRRLFDLGQFSQLFPIFPSRDEAVSATR